MLIIAIYLALALGLTLWILHRSGLVPRLPATTYEPIPNATSHDRTHYYSSYNYYTGAAHAQHHHGFARTLNLSRPASLIYLSTILLFILALVVLIK